MIKEALLFIERLVSEVALIVLATIWCMWFPFTIFGVLDDGDWRPIAFFSLMVFVSITGLRRYYSATGPQRFWHYRQVQNRKGMRFSYVLTFVITAMLVSLNSLT